MAIAVAPFELLGRLCAGRICLRKPAADAAQGDDNGFQFAAWRIECWRLPLRPQSLKTVAPRQISVQRRPVAPAFRPAMDQDDKRTFTSQRHAELDAVGLDNPQVRFHAEGHLW
jgi:hypothetical protein